jgi:hypothetical protein
MNRLLLALPLSLVAACGSDSSPSSPSVPAATTTSAVTVTVSSPIRMGQTTQATGTESLSNGQTRSITAGWLSDAPSVASVTNAGVVTANANGRATIFVVANGRQGQQVVRVVPDYEGRWNGGLRVTSCTETGVFTDLDFCDESPIGTTYRFNLNVSQSGEQLSAIVDYGAPFVFPNVTAPVREDGGSSFMPSLSVTESGVTMTVSAEFNINSTRVGQLIGTVTEVYRLPNFNGEGRLVQEIVGTTRTGSPSTVSSSVAGAERRFRVLRKLAAEDR